MATLIDPSVCICALQDNKEKERNEESRRAANLNTASHSQGRHNVQVRVSKVQSKV